GADPPLSAMPQPQELGRQRRGGGSEDRQTAFLRVGMLAAPPPSQSRRCTTSFTESTLMLPCCVKRAKTDRRFGGSRTAKTVETVQRFRLMAYGRFGWPNRHN